MNPCRGTGRVTLFASIAAIALAGCTVGPDYQKPKAAVPDSWVEVPKPTASKDAPASIAVPVTADISRWWDVLGDSMLTSLIQRGIAANLDLVQAEARVRQSRAIRDIAAAGQYPALGASIGASRSRSPGPSGGQTSNLFQAGLDASWEIDIFGGLRRSIEAADADVQSSVEARRGTLVTLAAEIALAYADLRGSQHQLSVARRNLAAQEETASIVRQRFEAGFVGQLDVANADSQTAITRSRIPSLESSVRQSLYSLSLLLALQPGELIAELSEDAPLPNIPPDLPIGLPADLLARRPDIRQAEADLHAATARIGIATADRFPRFTVGGSLGIQGTELKSLGNLRNHSWSIGPSASWTLFDGGAISGNIRSQEAATDAAFAAYEQTVLTALREVESSLIVYEKEQERHAALREGAEASRLAVELSTQRYTEGATDFLNVLSAQRSLFDSEDALAQSDRLIVQGLVTIYKSLGGGWNESDESAAPKAAAQ